MIYNVERKRAQTVAGVSRFALCYLRIPQGSCACVED